MMTDQIDPPMTFTIQDVRRVMDLPQLFAFVADQRGAAEFDRRVAGGLYMPEEEMTPLEKARFLRRPPYGFPQPRYDGQPYALDDITDQELQAYLASPDQPTPPGWVHKLTGYPPDEATKPWEPAPLRFGVQPPPGPGPVEVSRDILFRPEDPENPYRVPRPEPIRQPD